LTEPSKGLRAAEVEVEKVAEEEEEVAAED
jgi:hypothetical protein